jgi:hypothetical protein
MFYKLKMKVDLERAREYYFKLENEYQHRRWESRLGDTTIHGWSIHVLNGITDAFGFYDKATEPLGVENYYRSEICFDWAEEILNLFPYGYRSGVSVNPTGTIVPSHIDENWVDMMGLHIPIITNKDYVWITTEGTRHLEEGSVYLVDTSRLHSTINKGACARVHFGMNIPRANWDDIKKFM